MIGFLGFLGALTGSAFLAGIENIRDLSRPVGTLNGYPVAYDRKGRRYINYEPVKTEKDRSDDRFKRVVGCRTGKVYEDEKEEYIQKGIEEFERAKKAAHDNGFDYYCHYMILSS